MKKTIKNAISKFGAAIRNLLSFCFASIVGIAAMLIKGIIYSPKYLFYMITLPIALLAASVGIYRPLRLISLGELSGDAKRSGFVKVFFFALISPLLVSYLFLQLRVEQGYENGKKAFDKSNSVLNSLFKPLIDCLNVEPAARNTESIYDMEVKLVKLAEKLEDMTSKVVEEPSENNRETITESQAKPIQFTPVTDAESLQQLAEKSEPSDEKNNVVTSPGGSEPVREEPHVIIKQGDSLITTMHKLEASF